MIGDGTGGSDVYDGLQPDGLACIKACQKRKESDSSINGATFGVAAPYERACYCEREMTGVNPDAATWKWKTCKFQGIRAFYFYKKVGRVSNTRLS